jgi:hypothetical protein
MGAGLESHRKRLLEGEDEMPTKLETAVYGVLGTADGERWKSSLRAHVQRAIVKRARDLLGAPPFALPDEWDKLDDVDYRAAAAGSAEACATEVTRAIAGDDDSFSEFKSAVEAVDLGLSRAKLVNALLPELTRLIQPTAVRAYAEAATPVSIWRDLADLIAREIHAAENKNPPLSEADLLHWSLLAGFFQVSTIPEAARLGKTFRKSLTRGRFNIRGSLLRNVERASMKGIADPTLTHVPYAPVTLASAHRAASQLFESVAEESAKIPAGKGAAIVTIGDRINDATTELTEEDRRRGITNEMVVRSRVFRYQQYEYSALSLSAIASTEFCLRCAAEARTGLGLDPRFAGQTDIVDALPLTGPLKDELRALFSSTGPNFRNKSLHGCFLEIESRRTEITMSSGIAAGIGVPPLNMDNDPYIPKNAAAVALKTLADLDAELAPHGLVHAGSTKWTSHFCLDAGSLAFATGLSQPMLDVLNDDGQRRKVVGFVKEAFPSLSIPIQIGMFNWADPKPGASPIQLFGLLAVMFEPAMRLVAHAAGFEIFRRGNPGGIRVARYRMLDDEGFLAAPFLDWIETGLPASEKADARKTITTGVRCRDAFAHGAIANFADPIRKAYGAVMSKSIYLLVTSAINQGI